MIKYIDRGQTIEHPMSKRGIPKDKSNVDYCRALKEIEDGKAEIVQYVQPLDEAYIDSQESRLNEQDVMYQGDSYSASMDRLVSFGMYADNFDALLQDQNAVNNTSGNKKLFCGFGNTTIELTLEDILKIREIIIVRNHRNKLKSKDLKDKVKAKTIKKKDITDWEKAQ